MNTQADENALVRAAQQGDVEAFNALVLRYQDLAYTVAYRVMGESEAAADATQEAFIAAFRKLRQFRGKNFRAWLLRIVTNACYDELRRRQRRPTVSLDALSNSPRPAAPSPLHAPQESPEQHLQRRELHDAIQRCLNALPAEQRIVAVLADVQGYSYQEVAHIARLRLGTVKSRLSRARARLRECLQAVRELLPAAYRLKDEPTRGPADPPQETQGS